MAIRLGAGHIRAIRSAITVLAALVFLSSAALCALEAPQALRSLTEEDTLLVIAPHPDDEAISSMGLMLEAKRAGAEVHVLYITNGEYPVTSMLANNDRKPLDSNAFIALGYARQKEASAVLEPLDVNSVTFLGYPDSFLNDMTGPEHWKSSGISSTRTKRRDVPFENSPSYGKLNTGSNLLADLCNAIRTIQPSMIVFPSTDDSHPDHSTAGVLTQIAAESCRMESGGSYRPQLLSYLVHVRDIAWNTGYRANREKLPLPWMEGRGLVWLSLPVSKEDEAIKRAAVLSFATQGAAVNNTLLSLIRTNEIFCDASPLAYASAGGIIEAALPSAETYERRAHPAADIEGFGVDAATDGICLTMKLAGSPSSRYAYILRAYYADADGCVVGVAEVKVRGDLCKLSAASSEGTLSSDDILAQIRGNVLEIRLADPPWGIESTWVIARSTYSIGDAILDSTPFARIVRRA